MAAPRTTLGHYRGDSLTHPMLIVNQCVLHFSPEGHREPRNEVGSLSLAERFLLQCLNSLGKAFWKSFPSQKEIKSVMSVMRSHDKLKFTK